MDLKKSTFKGSNWGILWRTLLVSYAAFFSLFIAAPWLLSWYYKWYWRNVVIDNQRLKFTGKGRDLFHIYIYFIVSLVTFGIGALFMLAWLERKTIKHIHFHDLNDNESVDFQLLDELKSMFDSGLIDEETYKSKRDNIIREQYNV